MAKTAAKLVIDYTPNELEAIKILKANAGSHLTAEELGVSSAVLTSLIKKANDERPMAEGVERVMLQREDKEVEVVKTKTVKAYWI